MRDCLCLFCCETIIWRGKERSRIRAVIRELCRIAKGVDVSIDESVLWFGHIKRMMFVEECVGNCLLGQLQKR